MKKLLLAVLVLIGLQTQAQVNYCDSISYTTSSNINYPFEILGNTPTIPGIVCAPWIWTVCNSSLCFSDTGQFVSFGQVSLTDTLKVCYEVSIIINNMSFICMNCDSLVYNGNSWVLLNMGNPTAVNELELNTINDGKIYDMLGRELNEIPVGTMYIQNGKKYIKLK